MRFCGDRAEGVKLEGIEAERRSGSIDGKDSILGTQQMNELSIEPDSYTGYAFVDQTVCEPMPKAEPMAEPMGESAHEEFGEPARRVSVVDRDLGLDGVNQRRRGGYACPCCGHGAKRVMRVRVVNDQRGHSRWVALCAVCAATMLARMPGTIVGGVVHPTRRRRPIRQQAGGVNRRAGQIGIDGRRERKYRRAG